MADRMVFAKGKSHFVLKILLVLFAACHDKLGYPSGVLAAADDTWPFDNINLSQDMEKFGNAANSMSPVGNGLYLDGSSGTYVKIKGHDKTCMEHPSRCNITMGFFFKYRLASNTNRVIFFGNKDDNDTLYEGVNIFYKGGRTHVFVYGEDKYCTFSFYPRYGVWGYLGIMWENVGRLSVYINGWLGRSKNCGNSPSALKTRGDYYLGRDTFPIAYFKDLNIWYSKQNKTVLDAQWHAAFDNGAYTEITLKIIFSDLVYNAGNVSQWETNFRTTVQEVYTGDAAFQKISDVSISNSSGNASVSFKLRFSSISWDSVLTLQLALENGTFLGSHGVFDEAGCSGGNNFFCQVPKNHAASRIDHNRVLIRMDSVLSAVDEGYLYGYRVLFKNLDNPNSVWEQRLHHRNPPLRVWARVLSPHTNYSFRVMASSFKSEGLISETIQARTKEWVPSVGPEIIANYSVNSTAIYVEWNHTIPEDKVNGILIGYRVSWNESYFMDGDPHDSKGFIDVWLNNSITTNYTITSLHKYWLYKVGVAGRTFVGHGTYTQVSLRTHGDVPSAPPDNISLSMINATSLQAVWHQVPLIHRNGIILGYRVQLQPADGSPVLWNTTVGPQVYMFNFTRLMAYLNYSVQVLAFTEKGEGPYSSKAYQMTDESVPINSPNNLAAHNVSSSVIQVNWGYHEEARLTLGPLQGFTLYLHEANASDVFTADGRVRTRTTNVVNSTQIRGLEIFRLYNITIAARTSKGVGPINESVIVRTNGEVPDASPQSLTAYNTSKSSLYAYWQEVVADKRHGIMQGYKVSIYKLTNQGFQSLENRTYELSVRQANFTGLNTFTKHRIEVLGFNNFGDGPSKAVEVLTGESYPAKPPSNLTAVHTSSTKLRAFWKEVPECCRLGIIRGYHVTLVDTSNVSASETVTTSHLFKLFTNLKKFHVYNVSVEAFTSKGAGPKAFTLASTDQDVPEAPPQNVSGYNISQTEILISWDAVPKDKVNGIVTKYNVSYSKANWNYSRYTIFNGSAFQGVVDGLRPFTVYSFNVSASTIKGQGPFSAAIDVKTEEEAPQVSPGKFKGFNTSSTSIALRWDPIPEQNVAGVLRNFYITYRELNTDDNTTHTIAVPFSNLSFVLTNLRKYTNYSLEIKGATKFLGRPTEPIIITTDEDVPSQPPQEIKIQNSSSTSISIQWNPIPKDSVHGILLGIKLRYRSASRDNSVVFRSRARRAVEEGWSEYTDITLPPNALSYELTSLKKFTNCSILIFGFTSKGDGNVSQQFVVSTDEDVPSKPPSALMPFSRTGDFKMDVTWGPVPDGFVHGILRGYRIYFTKIQELGQAAYSQTRAVTVGPNLYNTTVTLLNNFAVYNLEITAFTIKGEGPRTTIKEGSTCNCPRVFKATWYHFPPYISFDNGTMGGFIPEILDIAIQACCSDCTQANGKSASVINYELDGKGNPGRKSGVKELIGSIDSDTDFSVPVNGYKDQTHYSLYRYVKLAESPGVAFITVMDTSEKVIAIANVFFYSWPLLLMSFFMMIVAGMIMWVLECRQNKEEFPRSFFQGAFEGLWWAFVTSTTIGYGDRCPKGILSRIFAIAWTLSGLVVLAILTGKIATVLTGFGYQGPYISLYGTQVAAISNNSDFRLGIRKNAKVNTVRDYKTYEEISQALGSQEVKGALVDLYVLSSHKHLFEDPRFRIVRVYDYKASYGVVLAGNSMKLDACFAEQIKSDAAHVFESIEENVKILREPQESPGEQQSTELFRASSTKFITAMIVIVTLLILATVIGISFEVRRDKTSEALTQSKDLQNEMRTIVETFLANMEKMAKAMSKRHRRQQCQTIRAERESDHQAAMAVNQDYEVLSSRDIRLDWSPRPNSLHRVNSDPTTWPFSSSEMNNLTVPTATQKRFTSPLNRRNTEPTTWPFTSSETKNLTFPTITKKRFISPLNRRNSDPTTWPFTSSETKNLTFPTITKKRFISPLNRRNSDPTMWPFTSSETNNLTFRTITQKRFTSPLNREKTEQVCIVPVPFTLEPNVRVVDETRL